MVIGFINNKHEKLVNNFDLLVKKYNKRNENIAEEILISLNILKAAPTLVEIPPYVRPHPLKGEYKGCFAIDVTKKYRIIFKPDHKNDPNFRIDNYKTISKILIIELYKDYH